jgi:hypothetical protein
MYKKLRKSTKGIIYTTEFRKGSCIVDYVYLQNVVCAESFKKQNHFNNCNAKREWHY